MLKVCGFEDCSFRLLCLAERLAVVLFVESPLAFLSSSAWSLHSFEVWRKYKA